MKLGGEGEGEKILGPPKAEEKEPNPKCGEMVVPTSLVGF